jgi:DNA repair exonuclease SbcCD ATPase subunit
VRKVSFKQIRIQNFLSVGKDPLILNYNSGISLITGENRDKGGRNGVGKSTVVESLYWALFGNTIREIKRDKIIHNQSKGNCEVKLKFEVSSAGKLDQYILTRSAEPNGVSLLCNNVDITRSSMPKTDELIKEIIGATEEVFQNAVIMSANNTMPFMAQKKVDKRKFVEGVLHLGIFGEMLLQIRSDYNDSKKINDLRCSSFSEKQKNLELYNQQFQKTEDLKSSKINQLNQKILENKNNISNISKSDNVEEQKKELESLITKKESKIKKLEKLSEDCQNESLSLWKNKHELESEIKNVIKEIDKLKNTNTSCPTCKRDYDVDISHLNCLRGELEDKLKDFQIKLKDIDKNIKGQTSGCNKIKDAIETLEKELKKHQKDKQSLALISQQINQLNERNAELEEEILELKNSKNEFEVLIENCSKEISLLEDEILDLQKKLNILESAKYVVSEEGVKTFIIKKMLNLLNSRLNFYLQALETPCKCEFNESFEETIFNERGVECSYFNFSGGERKRIDLAILFMFQDILRMQTGTSFSLSMYDELFDSALDEKGVDKILNILKERVKSFEENIYIISHNKASIKVGIDNVILLEKQDGKTRIVPEII